MLPSKIELDADEIDSINLIRVARYLGQPPDVIQKLPYHLVAKTLAVMIADQKIEAHEAAKLRQYQQRRRNRGKR